MFPWKPIKLSDLDKKVEGLQQFLALVPSCCIYILKTCTYWNYAEMGKIQHQPISGSTEYVHLIGREAIYFTSIIPDNDSPKRGLNQEMLIRFWVGDKVGVSITDSIPHCHTKSALKKGKSQ